MSQKWEKRALGGICAFVRGPFGGSLKKEIFVEHGFAVYEQQHAIYDQFDDVRYFVDESKFVEMKRFELQPNDLIMSCSGTIGRVAIAPPTIKRGIINQALLKMTPSHEVVPTFLKYWMVSSDFQESLAEHAGGAAIQNVASVGVLKQIKMPLPPFCEQVRIVAILDEAFEAIATAKANAEKNLQNARLVLAASLQETFARLAVDFGSVRLGSVCSFENGDRGKNYPGKQHRVAEGIPFINAGHLTEDGLDFGDMDYISSDRFALLGNGKIQPNDILFCLRGSLGKFANVCDLALGAIASSLVILRPGQTLAHDYLMAYLSSGQCAEQIERFKGGAAQPNLGAKDLKQFELPLAPLAVQREAASRLDDLRAHTRFLEGIYSAKLAALDELKKSLLHQAFSGQL